MPSPKFGGGVGVGLSWLSEGSLVEDDVKDHDLHWYIRVRGLLPFSFLPFSSDFAPSPHWRASLPARSRPAVTFPPITCLQLFPGHRRPLLAREPLEKTATPLRPRRALLRNQPLQCVRSPPWHPAVKSILETWQIGWGETNHILRCVASMEKLRRILGKGHQK